MRRYLAVIFDSFHEALHSRVLWLLAIAITLLLALLAPLGYHENLTVDLLDNSVHNWPLFALKLRDESRRPGTIAAHVASRLDEPAQKALAALEMPDEADGIAQMKFARTLQDLRVNLNNQLKRRDFYSETVWREVPLATEEGRILRQRGVEKCSDREVARLNRLLFEAAFPDDVEASPQVSLQFHYLAWDVLDPLPFRRDQATKRIEFVVGWIMKYFVGVIGVIVAILVTASVIPQMFDPGSLNLLLSKPISRSLLFLSKFIGGCAFIVCNATYLILGLWLILGVRFGIWDSKLLFAIPIYLFMFAIYYTVSAMAGVIWRNPIVSIALTVLFWLICFLAGLAKWLVETRYIEHQRLVRVVPAGDSLIAVNEMGRTLEWNPQSSTWNRIFDSDIQRMLEVPMYVIGTIPTEILPVGPVYDSEHDRLISIQRNIRGGQIGQMTVYTGDRSEGWKSIKGRTASIGTLALVRTPQGRLINISTFGIEQLVGDLTRKPEPLKVLGLTLPLPNVSPFVPVGPETPVLLAKPSAVAVHPDTGNLAIYSRGQLTLLRWNDEGRYERLAERALPLDPGMNVVLGWTGHTVLLGRDDGILVLYDDVDLKERGHWRTTGSQPPRFIEAAPGGQWFAVTLHGGKLWLVNANKDEASLPRFAGSGPISCASFAGPHELYVVDKSTRLTKYSLPDGRQLERFAPPSGPLEIAYDFFLLPVYTLCPKPGDLDDTVEYILSGRKSVETGPRERTDLRTARQQLDPWGPVWSSALFVVVMLGMCCVYLEWQEF